MKKEIKENNEYTITVYTYQSPNVLNKLKQGKTYIASYKKGMFTDYENDETKNPYRELARVLGLKNCPIFGALDKEELWSMMLSSSLETSNRTELLTLEVPMSHVHETEYYTWTDYIYALEDPREFEETSGITLEDLENQLRHPGETDLCQVVIDKIEPEWLINEEKQITESIESKEQVLDKVDKMFGQKEPYMWSTYILPNGHFLNPENHYNSDEHFIEYEHSDFFNPEFNPYGESLFDTSIKMNVTYPYLYLPDNKPTPEQFQAIKEIIAHKNEFEYAISDIEDRLEKDLGNIKEPLMILSAFDNTAFDLSVYSADDIIKEINKAYMTKSFLKEELEELSNEYDSEGNQLTKAQAEFFKNSKVRDTQGRLLVCYHGSDSEFDVFDNAKIIKEPGFWFATNKSYVGQYGKKTNAYYLNIDNPIDIDGMWELGKKIYGKNVSEDELKTEEFRNLMIRNKFSGVIYDEDDYTSVIIAFEPNQIKTITNKNPTNSNNINEDIVYRGSGINDLSIPRYLSKYTGTFFTPSEDYASMYGDVNEYDLDNNSKIYKAHKSNSVTAELDLGSFDSKLLKEFTARYLKENINNEDSSFFEFSEYESYPYFDCLDQWYGLYEDYFGEDYDYDPELESFSEWCNQIVLREYLEKKGYVGIYYAEEDGAEQYQIWGTFLKQIKHEKDFGDTMNEEINTIKLSDEQLEKLNTIIHKETELIDVVSATLKNKNTLECIILDYTYDDAGESDIVEYYKHDFTQADWDMLVSNSINEDIWTKKTYKGTRWNGEPYEDTREIYAPEKDSKYQRLLRKPINQLTYDELKYIYVVRECWYLQQVLQFNTIEDAYKRFIDKETEKYLKECYEFISNLSFPLTIYRAIRESEFQDGEFNISGKKSSLSWSTNLDIYKNEKSKFKNTGNIVSCNIDSNIVDTANTINNFMHYTASNKTNNYYGEYEITLKSNFKQSDLRDLHWVDKDGNGYYNKMLESLLDRAKEEFGTTTNWKSAGYINTDGTLLDLSYGSGRRIGDHRDIAQIFDDDTDGTDALIEYQKEGHIRYIPEMNGLDILINNEPTEAQYNAIKNLCNRISDELIVDFTDEKGITKDSIEYNSANPNKVVSDIKEYFKTGKVPYKSELQQFRESEQLKESLKEIDGGYITDSPYDILNLITNKPKAYRILYDKNIDKYMIGDGWDTIHLDLLENAIKDGYYSNNEKINEILDELVYMENYDINHLILAKYNYFDTGTTGEYNIEPNIDPYLIVMFYLPKSEDNGDAFSDGYDKEYKGNSGTIYTRDSDLEDCELYKLWKNYNKK